MWTQIATNLHNIPGRYKVVTSRYRSLHKNWYHPSFARHIFQSYFYIFQHKKINSSVYFIPARTTPIVIALDSWYLFKAERVVQKWKIVDTRIVYRSYLNETVNLHSNLNQPHRTLLRMPPGFVQNAIVLLFTLSILRQMVDHLVACAQAE